MSEPKNSAIQFILRAHHALRVSLLLALLGLLSSFVFSGTDPSITGGEVTVKRDIIYYDGPGFYAPRHILDLYLPADQTDFPVLIFIHGGGWTSGNKNLYGGLGNIFARAGIGVVIANYRLTDNSPGRVVHPGHIEDVARAFAWTYNNIADYGGNPEKIFISGHSAGGHLVALLALDPRYLAAHGLSPDYIAGVMGISGVYDVRFGPATVFGQDPAQRADASPLMHVGKSQPPMQIIYADNDLQGLGPQAVRLNKALIQVESEVELIEVAGRTHITIIVLLASGADPMPDMLRFINEHL
jgi:acetyl esterase/lipase